MEKLTKARAEQVVRAFWKQQAEPKDVRTRFRSARVAEKLAADWLRSTGLDVKKEQALRKRYGADWDRGTAEAAAYAAKRWAGHTKRMQASAIAWATNLMAIPGGPPQSRSFFISQPLSILASDSKIVRDTHIE